MNLNSFNETASAQIASAVLPIPLGVDNAGVCVVRDLEKLGHLLIAGVSASGKSAFIHAFISTLTQKYKPGDLEFLMADPKMVELTSYNGSPYLPFRVETEPRKCLGLLVRAVSEKRSRLKEPKKTGRHLVIIVDTFSDLAYLDRPAFERVIADLTQSRGRDGAHLVMSDSRFDPQLFTEHLKQCFPAKIAFNTIKAEHSRLILGQPGAETLSVPGELLFLGPGEETPLRLTAPLH